jgi:epoxyqueuosine reductase
MDKAELSKRIKQRAGELGFELVGVSSAKPVAHMNVYRDWIESGHHGEMRYLEGERAIEARRDPTHLLPECKSILALGMPYFNPANAANKKKSQKAEGRIAAYAWGDDYHEALKVPLKALVAYIEELNDGPVPNRWYTDTGPILESEIAQRAGLGWIGKNSLLINPQKGSFFLLAEIFLGIELEPDEAVVNDYCGSCSRCIEACPTDCILPNRTLDAERCISYLSIELKGSIPLEMRPQMDNWVFGCDICQEVCPWNIRFSAAKGYADFAANNNIHRVDLEKELSLSPRAFNKKFKGNPVKRPKRRGYLRNVAVALGNSGQESSVKVLKQTLQNEEEALVRGHAAWALGEIGGMEAKKALEQARNVEQDEEVLAEISSALQR